MTTETTEHTAHLEPALALNGWTAFCSCGALCGFASTAHDAELIHRDHVLRARARELEAQLTPAELEAHRRDLALDLAELEASS